MLTLLYETVLSYEDTWVECLGDLSRYRMAVEQNANGREEWTGISRYWYYQTGRLYHHLVILPGKILCSKLVGIACLHERWSVATAHTSSNE